MPQGNEPCPVCGGTGWTMGVRDGLEVAVRCACRSGFSAKSLLRATHIPPRYEHCTIEGFQVWEPAPQGHLQAKAKRLTREFVDTYPGLERGLVFMGSVGTGKTHLAVAALRELVATKHVRGLYANALDLVQQLQMSFDGGGPSRDAILAPVTEAELLVLDELGAGKLTEWVRDLLYYVINSRYMSRRLTIFTTNYLDAPQPLRRAAPPRGTATGPYPAEVDAGGFERWQETLADRISDRLRSRLFEMCDVIELRGEDFRSRRLTEPGSLR